MTNHFPTLAAAAVLTAGLTLAAPAAADSHWVPGPRPDHDTRPCVSAGELDKVRPGWTRDRFERATETRNLGDRMEVPEITVYGYFYPSCRPGVRVIAYFRVLDDSLIVAKRG